MTFKLSDHGYVLNTDNTTWSRPGYSSIAYNDGDEPEQRVAGIIGEAADLSVLSNELKQFCTDWPSTYHLSAARANILRPFRDELQGDILEVGSGCGAITRYLGECGANVLALEGSLRRASITRSRTRDLSNVTVLSETFDQLQVSHQFDVITLIGVLEYANLFTQDDNPHLALLKRVRTLLKPDGILLLAIENQLGLKYFAGASEDHLGQAMYGIEGRYQPMQPQTFGRHQLTSLLMQAGFTQSEFLAPFPDYKLPASIVTLRGMETDGFDASAFAWQSVNADPQLPPHLNFSLELAWPEVFKNGLAMELANSFLIRAAQTEGAGLAPELLACHYSTNRIPQYCKETRFTLQDDNDITVRYQPLYPANAADNASPIIKFSCPLSTPYIQGRILSWEFIEIVTRDGWQTADVAALIQRYVKLLSVMMKQASLSIDWLNTYQRLPGFCFDLVPRNIVIQADGTPVAIDTEWVLGSEIELGHLLFRSLLLMIASIRHYGISTATPSISRGDFIKTSLQQAGYTLTDEDLTRYIEQEAGIQHEVTSLAIQEFLTWHPTQPLFAQKIAPTPEQTTNYMQAIHDKDVHIANLEAMIAALTKAEEERNTDHWGLSQALTERNEECKKLHHLILTKNAHTASLEATALRLGQALMGHKAKIDGLNQAVQDKETHIQNIEATLAQQAQALAEREACTHQHSHEVQALRASTSWKITAPLRWPADQIKRVLRLLKMLPMLLQRGGGLQSTAKKAINLAQREGLAGVKHQLGQMNQELIAVGDDPRPFVHRNDYSEWIRRYDTLDDALRQQIRDRIAAMPRRPKISVLMPVYEPPLHFLNQAIESIRNQLYQDWELCIADDASKNEAVQALLQKHANEDSRIKVIFRKQNGHISEASNSALEKATGEFIALLDHDDMLPEHALFYVAQAILDHPDAGLIYSDEDKINAAGNRQDAYFKTDWNPDLFLSQNMISHLGAYKAELVRKVQGFREGLEGSQDYDLALRCIEQLDVGQIVHIPRVLYHWRIHAGSTALAGSEKSYAFVAGERALNEHFQRMGIAAQAGPQECGMYRVHYQLPVPAPLVSLIIPTRNGLNLIRQCVNSVLDKTRYDNYEILIVDNNSDDAATLQYFASLASNPRIRILRDERPFNYSALNNAAAQQANGEYLCLMNNDIEVIAPEWLSEMISIASQPGVGAVGARLRYPDDTLQHGGVITGIGGVASHSHKYFPVSHHGYFGRAQLIHTVSAVTGACMVIKKQIYEEMGGLDETSLAVAFNDVDFCLRVQQAGYRNVWTPYADLYHHESASRGDDNTPEKQARFQSEVDYMHSQWGAELQNDPAYNPNLTLNHDDFSLAWPPRVGW